MHAARRRIASAHRSDLIEATRRAYQQGCTCSAHTSTPGGSSSSCPSFVPPDLVAMLQNNKAAVDVISLFCEVISYALLGSIFLAPAAAPVLAISTVLTSLAGGCDLGASLQGVARQASLGCKIAAAAATAVGLVPIAALLVPLAGILDSVAQSKAPKMADVVGFGQSAAAAGNVDPSSIQGGFNPGPILTDPTVNALGKQAQALASSPAPKSDTQTAYLASVRAAVGNAVVHGTPMQSALAHYVDKQSQVHVDDNTRANVVRFLAKVAGPADDGAFDAWDAAVPQAPFTPTERTRFNAKETALGEAKTKARRQSAHDVALDEAKAKARANTLAQEGVSTGSGLSTQLAQLHPALIGAAPPATKPVVKVPPLKKLAALSTPAKVGIGAAALTALGIFVKVVIL